MPHLVQMQKTHAADGLVVVTMDVGGPDSRQDALRFLTEAKIDLIHLALDPNEMKIWEEKLKFDGAMPRTYVFDRSGKLVKDFLGADEGPAIDALVLELLKQK